MKVGCQNMWKFKCDSRNAFENRYNEIYEYHQPKEIKTDSTCIEVAFMAFQRSRGGLL